MPLGSRPARSLRPTRARRRSSCCTAAPGASAPARPGRACCPGSRHAAGWIAPDWLGFGRASAVVDFADRQGRMLRHLAGTLRQLGVAEADFVGLSMGGSLLLRELTADSPLLQVRRAVLVSAGGAPITPQAAAALTDFDGTEASMLAQVRMSGPEQNARTGSAPASCAEQRLVALRMEAVRRPGVYESFASLRIAAPGGTP